MCVPQAFEAWHTGIPRAAAVRPAGAWRVARRAAVRRCARAARAVPRRRLLASCLVLVGACAFARLRVAPWLARVAPLSSVLRSTLLLNLNLRLHSIYSTLRMTTTVLSCDAGY
jgi:hypothetical protein